MWIVIQQNGDSNAKRVRVILSNEYQPKWEKKVDTLCMCNIVRMNKKADDWQRVGIRNEFRRSSVVVSVLSVFLMARHKPRNEGINKN